MWMGARTSPPGRRTTPSRVAELMSRSWATDARATAAPLPSRTTALVDWVPQSRPRNSASGVPAMPSPLRMSHSSMNVKGLAGLASVGAVVAGMIRLRIRLLKAAGFERKSFGAWEPVGRLRPVDWAHRWRRHNIGFHMPRVNPCAAAPSRLAPLAAAVRAQHLANLLPCACAASFSPTRRESSPARTRSPTEAEPLYLCPCAASRWTCSGWQRRTACAWSGWRSCPR